MFPKFEVLNMGEEKMHIYVHIAIR
jgi:hypothetical protein